MSQPLDLANPMRTIHVGVVMMNSVTELLDVAPVDLLNGISKAVDDFPDEVVPGQLKKQAIDAIFHWVNESGSTAQLTSGLRVQPTDSFASCPPLDVVIMGAHRWGYAITEAELDFVRKNYESCSAFIAICGGSQAALEAGLLEGKTAAAPRPLLDILRATHPETTWVEKRWHQDGKIWTSGALLNGLDLMRAFGEKTFGGNKEGTLMNAMLDVGGWPKRDVDYGAVEQ